MKKYAQLQASVLLRRLAFQAGRAARTSDADAVHDLRVAIRRFGRCLRAFAQFFPGAARKKILRRAKALMKLAAVVRDRDIALELLGFAGIPATAAVAVSLRRERAAAERILAAELHRWARHGFSHKWRERLEL